MVNHSITTSIWFGLTSGDGFDCPSTRSDSSTVSLVMLALPRWDPNSLLRSWWLYRWQPLPRRTFSAVIIADHHCEPSLVTKKHDVPWIIHHYHPSVLIITHECIHHPSSTTTIAFILTISATLMVEIPHQPSLHPYGEGYTDGYTITILLPTV